MRVREAFARSETPAPADPDGSPRQAYRVGVVRRWDAAGVYREWSGRLGGAAVLWRRAGGAPGAVRRILPDGCLDLIWLGDELIVAGPDTRPHLFAGRPGASYVGLRFAPGAGPGVLGVPAHTLRDARPRLSDLWPVGTVNELTDRLAAADPGEAGAILEGAAAPRLAAAPPPPALTRVARLIRDGAGVSGTAAAIGLSERQLHRRCLDGFGYGPKTLGRILRLRRALTLARSGTPFGAVAAEAGYADQAHLSREVRTLTGVPLSTLLHPLPASPGIP